MQVLYNRKKNKTHLFGVTILFINDLPNDINLLGNPIGASLQPKEINTVRMEKIHSSGLLEDDVAGVNRVPKNNHAVASVATVQADGKLAEQAVCALDESLAEEALGSRELVMSINNRDRSNHVLVPGLNRGGHSTVADTSKTFSSEPPESAFLDQLDFQANFVGLESLHASLNRVPALPGSLQLGTESLVVHLEDLQPPGQRISLALSFQPEIQRFLLALRLQPDFLRLGDVNVVLAGRQLGLQIVQLGLSLLQDLPVCRHLALQVKVLSF